jgi:hypothetical protein
MEESNRKPWTPAEDDQIQALRREGFSTSIIAERLGRTRNAIIGRLGRTSVPAPERPINKSAMKKRRYVLPPVAANTNIECYSADQLPIEPDDLFEGGVTLVELKSNQCRNVTGHNGYLATYCAEASPVGHSYCPACRAKIYIPLRRKG